MLEDNFQKNNYQDIFQEKKINKPNFVNQIDNIIKKYKYQLDKLKANTNQNNQDDKNDTLPIITPNTIQSKTLLSVMENPEIKEKENISNIESNQFSKEVQNDNIKLQSALTAEKLNILKLNSQIENYEIELNKSKQIITELHSQLVNKENEFLNKLNSIYNDINKIKDDNNLNINIIQRFFDLFNKNIDLFNKSKIISFDQNTKINYIDNDSEGKNEQISIFVVNSLDTLINKLLKDNREIYEQLIETKKIIDEQNNNIQNEIDGLKKIKEENIVLKNQLQKLVKDNDVLKYENLKLKNNLIDLNNYINNNMNIFNDKINNINNINNISSNNNIYNGNDNDNNYKKQIIYSYNDNNNNINNYTNKNNKNLINNYYNSPINIKNNYIDKNSMTDNRTRNDNYRNNMNNNYYFNYSKTDERKRKKSRLYDENIIDNNYEYNIVNNLNNVNNNYDYNKINENQSITETGFERPIDKLKKKIMLLEQQIKDSPEQ